MTHTADEIGAKMDALGLWEKLKPYNFAVRPKGLAMPYFCSYIEGSAPAKHHLLMLDGWQTMHDFVRSRLDRDFGYYTQVPEFPHWELITVDGLGVKFVRYDTGYMPVEATEEQKKFLAPILWEAYGILLRLEIDPKLLMTFADRQAIFARVQGADGIWRDEPLAIPPPRPYVETITIDKGLAAQAKDLPILRDEVLQLDFGMVPTLTAKIGSRPRSVYALRAVDAQSGGVAMDLRMAFGPEATLLRFWEEMPVGVLREIIRRGHVPGEIALRSGRVFRFLRPLCLELPLKLSLHDKLPKFDQAFPSALP